MAASVHAARAPVSLAVGVGDGSAQTGRGDLPGDPPRARAGRTLRGPGCTVRPNRDLPFRVAPIAELAAPLWYGPVRPGRLQPHRLRSPCLAHGRPDGDGYWRVHWHAVR